MESLGFKRPFGSMQQASPSLDRTTRARLLEAAEEVFARSGFSGASIREITGAAGANVSAVHYHFGGKHELFRSVLERRVQVVNEARLAALQALDVRHCSAEDLVRAFVEPALIAVEAGGTNLIELVSRAMADPEDPWGDLVRQGLFAPVLEAFAGSLQLRVPELGDHEAALRLQVWVGSLAHQVLRHDSLGDSQPAPKGPPSPRSPRAERLIHVLAATCDLPPLSCDC